MREVQDWIESYMLYTNNTEPPFLYRKWTAVSTIAAVLQRKVWLRWREELVFYPNMYIVLVGPSGVRKSQALGPSEKLLRAPGVSISLSADSGSIQGIMQDLIESNRTDIDPTTGELMPHCSLTIHQDEITVLLGHQDPGLVRTFCQWYDCKDYWRNRTIGRGNEEIYGLFVNMLGGTTQEALLKSLPKEAIGGGLTGRIIFVYEERKDKSLPYPVTTKAERELYEKLKHTLSHIHNVVGELQITKEFLERWIDWYHECDSKPPFTRAALQPYSNRRALQSIKTAIAISLSRSDDLYITRDHLEDAIVLLKQTEKKMAQTFSGFGESDKALVFNKIMEFIANRKHLTERDLMQEFLFDVDGWEELERHISTLAKHGFISRHIDTNQTKITYNPNNAWAGRFKGGGP